LVRDIVEAPRSTRLADKLLSPLIGKSVVVYLRRPVAAAPRTAAAAPATDALVAS
jgi:hypothetical protein